MLRTRVVLCPEFRIPRGCTAKKRGDLKFGDIGIGIGIDLFHFLIPISIAIASHGQEDRSQKSGVRISGFRPFCPFCPFFWCFFCCTILPMGLHRRIWPLGAQCHAVCPYPTSCEDSMITGMISTHPPNRSNNGGSIVFPLGFYRV